MKLKAAVRLSSAVEKHSGHITLQTRAPLLCVRALFYGIALLTLNSAFPP